MNQTAQKGALLEPCSNRSLVFENGHRRWSVSGGRIAPDPMKTARRHLAAALSLDALDFSEAVNGYVFSANEMGAGASTVICDLVACRCVMAQG